MTVTRLLALPKIAINDVKKGTLANQKKRTTEGQNVESPKKKKSPLFPSKPKKAPINLNGKTVLLSITNIHKSSKVFSRTCLFCTKIVRRQFGFLNF